MIWNGMFWLGFHSKADVCMKYAMHDLVLVFGMF